MKNDNTEKKALLVSFSKNSNRYSTLNTTTVDANPTRPNTISYSNRGEFLKFIFYFDRNC
jgi:hypothetical protein